MLLYNCLRSRMHHDHQLMFCGWLIVGWTVKAALIENVREAGQLTASKDE